MGRGRKREETHFVVAEEREIDAPVLDLKAAVRSVRHAVDNRLGLPTTLRPYEVRDALDVRQLAEEVRASRERDQPRLVPQKLSQPLERKPNVLPFYRPHVLPPADLHLNALPRQPARHVHPGPDVRLVLLRYHDLVAGNKGILERPCEVLDELSAAGPVNDGLGGGGADETSGDF